MLVITLDRITGEKKSVNVCQHKKDTSLNEIIESLAFVIASTIKSDKISQDSILSTQI